MTTPLPKAIPATLTQSILQTPILPTMTDENHILRPDEFLKLVDVAGCIPVKRHLGPTMDPVTASIDHMDFLAPTYAWDVLVLDSRITRVWRTSIETRIVATAWSFRTGEQRAVVGSAYMVAVATEEHASKRANADLIPPLLSITPEDKLLEVSADKRKHYRTVEKQSAERLPIRSDENPMMLTRPMTEKDSNGLGDHIFGGVILSQMYQAANACVKHYLGEQPFVCVRQDRMDFLQPAHIGDWLTTQAVVSKTWNTSMEVQVDCWAGTDTHPFGRLVASTYAVFIGRDDDGKPAPIPKFTPETDLAKTRSESACVRREHRRQVQALFENNL